MLQRNLRNRGVLFEENIISNESVIEPIKEQDTEGLSVENAENARPELTEFPNLTEYDTIFVGYPIWCGDMLAEILEWIEEVNFR